MSFDNLMEDAKCMRGKLMALIKDVNKLDAALLTAEQKGHVVMAVLSISMLSKVLRHWLEEHKQELTGERE